MPPVRPDTRTALLDAAEVLFSDRGFAAVGIREIVDRAGANIAAVQYHFGGKGELYREVVRRVMQRKGGEAAWAVLQDTPRSRAAAATAVARFIHQFLEHLLASPEAERCGNLIMHEAAEPTDAIDFVIEDFMAPRQARLEQVIAVLRPEATADDRRRDAQSILGQILHYRTYQAFVERLASGDLSKPTTLRATARHIAGFSLRGLGCRSRLIETALDAAARPVEISA